jgi:hypothetical protein
MFTEFEHLTVPGTGLKFSAGKSWVNETALEGLARKEPESVGFR